jgi:hypothetical protein
MNSDELKEVWQSQAAPRRLTVDADVLLQQLERTKKSFQTMIFWRDAREVGVALVMLPLWIWIGLKETLPWTWYLCIPAMLWIAGFMVVDRMRQKRCQPRPGNPLRECIKNSLAQVEHQIWLLKNVLWWYLLPPGVALAAFFGHVALITREVGWLGEFIVAGIIAVAALILWGVYWLNQRAVRHELLPRRQELQEFLASLDDMNHASKFSDQVGGSPPPLPNAKRRSFRVPLSVIIVAILLVPPVLLIGWYASVRTSNASAIRKLENEIRQRGEPLTLAELQASYPRIPDDENAAVALMALWKSEEPSFWQAFNRDERPLPERARENYDPALPFLGAEAQRIPRGTPLPSNALAAAESYLSAKASHLERVRAALRRPRFRFPVKIEAGPDALLPHLQLLKTEAQNFRLVALIASERGDKAAAIAAIKETAQTGQMLASEPLLISQLVRVACLNLALEGIEQLLSRQSLTAAELENLRLFHEEINLHGVARTALINERAFSLCIFHPEFAARATVNGSLSDDTGNPEQAAHSVRTGFGFIQSIGLMDPDRRLMLATFKEAIELAGQETPESLRKTEALFARVQTNATKFPPKILSAMMLPSLQKVLARYAGYEARRRAALIAIGVEYHRAVHESRVPEKLDDLVPGGLPAIPADPFDGQNLRFRKLERGYVVYSVGSDLQDDGGRERRRGSVNNADVTFTVER